MDDLAGQIARTGRRAGCDYNHIANLKGSLGGSAQRFEAVRRDAEMDRGTPRGVNQCAEAIRIYVSYLTGRNFLSRRDDFIPAGN